VPASRICPSQDANVKLFELLLETNAKLARSLSTRLESECEIPLAWFEVLLRLRQNPEGRLKMNEIADATVHSTGGTTRLIDRMAEAGLVERRNCPTDRRAIHVEITKDGNAKFDEAISVHLAYLEGEVKARLTNAERSTLATILTKLG
jgi:DNA-binding MarR family transcriptional regulator